MAGPSLGEISQLGNNGAGTAFGTAGVGGNATIVPFGHAVDFLSQAAREKADETRFKVLQFQKNLDNYYQNFNTLDVKGVMEADYPQLMSEYASLANDLANNMDVVRNPASNPEKMGELQRREAELRTKIAQSKQHVAFREKNMDFIRSSPELNTDENNQRLQSFSTAPIDERKPFTLSTPTVYDPAARAKAANAVAQTKLKSEQVKGRYLVTEDATKYLQDEYDKAWDALGTMQDKNGRTVIKMAEDAYSRLPTEFTTGKTFQQIDREVGRSLIFQDDVTKTLQADPVGMQEDAQANQRLMQQRDIDAAAARTKQQYDLMLRNQQAKVAPQAADSELLLTTTAKAFREKGTGSYTAYDRTQRKNVTMETVPLEAYEKMAMARQIPDENGKMIMQAPKVVVRDSRGLLIPIYDNRDGTDVEMGESFTPERFMRGYANAYFQDKEVPTLLKNAGETFKKETDQGTVDNFAALDTWIQKGKRGANFAATDEQRDAQTLTDAQYFVKYKKGKPAKQ